MVAGDPNASLLTQITQLDPIYVNFAAADRDVERVRAGLLSGNLLREGYPADQITVLKPGCDEIDGVRCVPDLPALAARAGRVDLLVVALSAAQAPNLVAVCIEGNHAESLIVIPAGFEEKLGGDERASRMRAAVAEARRSADGGPLINGGNCLGIRSIPGHVDTLFIPSASRNSFLASKLIREVARFGGDVTTMVPAPVANRLATKYPRS